MTLLTASSTTSNESDPYISRTDEAELETLRAMAQSQGIGDTLTDEQELAEMFQEIGLAGLDVNLADDGRG